MLQKPAEPEQPAVVAKVNGEKSGAESPMEDDEEEEEPQQKEKVHYSGDTMKCLAPRFLNIFQALFN